MLTLQEPRDFLQALDRDALVLTPNHQLAVALHETQGHLLRERGSTPVRPGADIMAIDVWLGQVWRELRRRAPGDWPDLLDPRSEPLLWRDIVRESSAGATLLNPDSAATSAAQAWTLMQTHDLGGDDLAAWLDDEARDMDSYVDLRAFLDWHRTFGARLAERNCIPLSSALERLVRGLEQDQRSFVELLPQHCLQFGFAEPPPLYARLLAQLERHVGCPAIRLATRQPSVHGWRCTTATAEIQAAAHWCRTVLEAEPEADIAVLVPDLQSRRALLERIFSHQLGRGLFSMPATSHVDSLPLIASALQLLSLNDEVLNTLEVCRTLRSPFLPQEDPVTARAALERVLRNEGELLLEPSRLRALCLQSGRDWYCPQLGERLQRFQELARRQRHSHAGGATAIQLILAQLEAMGWPGEGAGHCAREDLQQSLDSWEDLLDRLAETCELLQPRQYRPVLGLLRRLAADTPRPRQRFGQVRLMTPAEAQFLQFSHIWLMGLDDDRWPPIARINPLIPLPLQRQSGMLPDDPREHVLWHENLVCQHIARQCDSLQLSHPGVDDEGGERSASALFDRLMGESSPRESGAPDHALHPRVIAQRTAAEADSLRIHREPALLPLEPGENPRGGASIIEDQSRCPFRSLALHRLDAVELRDPQYGLNPMTTGIMLHAAMEFLWRRLDSFERLIAQDGDSLRALVREACEDAIRRTARQHPRLMQPRFRQLELERLQALLLDWLDEERRRPFSRIIDLEQSLSWQHGNLEIRLKLDRVEELLDGRLAIIDYKSGQSRTLRWTDPRPESPQLMLYLLAAADHYSGREVGALLFAHINAGEQVFTGLSVSETDYPGIDFQRIVGDRSGLGWDEIREQWRQSIEALAGEFSAGLCSVTPRSRTVCQHCHLQAFCRIDDRMTLADDIDEEAAAE